MKLTTRNGEIDLPRDFSFNMERSNPLLLDEGDSSVPATLPSSSRNLAAIDHRERIDRAEAYDDKVDAILEVGPIRKHGQLAFDTVHSSKGVNASFYIDNSDLYISSKNKTLKEIFARYNVVFGDVDTAMLKMQEIYEGADSDFKVFPVAVSPYEDNGEKVYQWLNRVENNSLVYETTIHEGDSVNSVPRGYGIAPFLRLSRLVELLFHLLGYEVTENCLAEWPFQRLVVVHNYSDCLCNQTVTLFYKDLVPSCTLHDFLTWLNNKWHVQPVVDSNSRKVRVVSMETMLAIGADMDITPIVEDDFTVQLNPSKRVVMTPTNSIEGTDPAAETFDQLIEKYGDFAYVNEIEFAQYPTTTPPVQNSLLLRRATGQFYGVQFDNTLRKLKLLGTNHFTYDRANSSETEDFSQSDVIPLMLCEGKAGAIWAAPFIGDRKHAHTSYNDSATDEKQDIIVVQAVTDTAHFFYYTTGTTQPVIPYKLPVSNKHFMELNFGTTPYDLYDACWSKFNNILLNHPTYLDGRVRFTIGQILGMDMTRLKLCQGQHLLPVSLSAPIAAKQGLTEAKYILVKTYTNGITDSAILPSAMSEYVWEVTSNIMQAVQALWTQMGGGPNFGDIDVPDTNWGVESHFLEYGSYSVQYVGEELNPGTPTQGDVVTMSRQAIITIHYREVIEYEPELNPQGHETYVVSHDCDETFTNQIVTFTFTAVPA